MEQDIIKILTAIAPEKYNSLEGEIAIHIVKARESEYVSIHIISNAKKRPKSNIQAEFVLYLRTFAPPTIVINHVGSMSHVITMVSKASNWKDFE